MSNPDISSNVPDEYIVVRGGTKPLPPIGTAFSAAAGPDKFDAGRGVPHGQIRSATAGEIRKRGGSVRFVPEVTRSGQINRRHVDAVEGKTGAFGQIEPNPVPKYERIA
jgi:hypothetical protein